MVTTGYARVRLEDDLKVAGCLGAETVEILPFWRELPDAAESRKRIEDVGLAVHSVHGGWGGQSLFCDRIDLASLDESSRLESVVDLAHCIAWADSVGAKHLVVHPGGLSEPHDQPARTEALLRSLDRLADLSPGARFLCVENMPLGVFPGSRMNDLAQIVRLLSREEVALILDTGHAEIVADAAEETRHAAGLLASTHVHDNDGKLDLHGIPGSGMIDWPAWIEALDEIDYGGTIMLECIRELRKLSEAELVRVGERLRKMFRMYG